MKDDLFIPREWFSKGNEDLNMARVLFKEGYFNGTGFHSHQAVEKYLKGYIISQNLKFKKKHNLELLLKICSKFNKNFDKFLNGVSEFWITIIFQLVILCRGQILIKNLLKSQ